MKQIIYGMIYVFLGLYLTPANSNPKAQINNEFGLDYEQAYVSDLKSSWYFYSAYYNYLFNDGKVGARLNHSRKFDASGVQYELHANGKIIDKMYGAISVAYSNKSQIQYPGFQYLGELYYIVQKTIELYLGQAGRIYPMFSNQKIYTYSAGIGKYFSNYLASFYVDSFSVSGELLFHVFLRRYFADKYSHIGMQINFGKVPDIGDIPPLDQLFLTKEKSININGQFSLYKSLYMRWGILYARQVYPNTIRYITDGSIGLLFRF